MEDVLRRNGDATVGFNKHAFAKYSAKALAVRHKKIDPDEISDDFSEEWCSDIEHD